MSSCEDTKNSWEILARHTSTFLKNREKIRTLERCRLSKALRNFEVLTDPYHEYKKYRDGQLVCNINHLKKSFQSLHWVPFFEGVLTASNTVTGTEINFVQKESSQPIAPHHNFYNNEHIISFALLPEGIVFLYANYHYQSLKMSVIDRNQMRLPKLDNLPQTTKMSSITTFGESTVLRSGNTYTVYPPSSVPPVGQVPLEASTNYSFTPSGRLCFFNAITKTIEVINKDGSRNTLFSPDRSDDLSVGLISHPEGVLVAPIDSTGVRRILLITESGKVFTCFDRHTSDIEIETFYPYRNGILVEEKRTGNIIFLEKGREV